MMSSSLHTPGLPAGMPRRNNVVRAALVALIALGCASPTSPQSDVLTIRARLGSFTLVNRTSESIYYFAIERQTSALVDWAPCSNPTTCPRVGPNGTVTLRYADIYGYELGRDEAVVYHWRLIPSAASSTGFTPDRVRSVIVALR